MTTKLNTYQIFINSTATSIEKTLSDICIDDITANINQAWLKAWYVKNKANTKANAGVRYTLYMPAILAEYLDYDDIYIDGHGV